MGYQVFLVALSSLLLSCISAAPSKPEPIIRVRDRGTTLPFVAKLNVSGSTLPEIDRAHVAGLKERARKLQNDSTHFQDKRQSSFGVINEAVFYVASVGVGTPASTFELIIDTGSSNTWVGSGRAFVETTSSQTNGQLMEVTYGSGFVIGQQFTDTVTLGPGLVIEQQQIGVAIISQGFEGVDGILGVGPVDLTQGTLQNDPNAFVPTVSDNLLSQGAISEEVLGIFFAPTTAVVAANGEMTFGGIDSSKITQDVQFFPLTSTFPSSEFWGIDQSVTYGTSGTTILSTTAGIVDTGTSLLLLATDGFDAYTAATGSTLDQNTGLLSISSANYANLQSLFLNVGGSTFEFTKNAQTWPRALNTAIGAPSNAILLIVNDLGSPSGEGFDFVDGFVFLERFYSVFDTTNNRVGFATTAHTNDLVN